MSNIRIPPLVADTSQVRVRVSSIVLRSVLSAAQPGIHEQGGVLVGQARSDGNFMIAASSPSFPENDSTKYAVRRDRQAAQNWINEVWTRSAGRFNWIGEWHTHPETNPSPSRRDRDHVANLFSESDHEHRVLFLLIGGLDNTFWFGVFTPERDLFCIHRGKPIFRAES